MVTWRDAQGPNGELWIQASELDELIEDYDADLIISFGVIVRETEQNWFMASHFHSTSVHSLMAIPKSAVVANVTYSPWDYSGDLRGIQEKIQMCIS